MLAFPSYNYEGYFKLKQVVELKSAYYILNVLYNFNTSISTKCGKNLSTVYETGKNAAYFSLK